MLVNANNGEITFGYSWIFHAAGFWTPPFQFWIGNALVMTYCSFVTRLTICAHATILCCKMTKPVLIFFIFTNENLNYTLAYVQYIRISNLDYP